MTSIPSIAALRDQLDARRDGEALRRLRFVINYGINRARFISLPADARIRGRFSPAAVEEAGGGIQVTWSAVIEGEHDDKPACIAEWIVRYVPLQPL
jgi:acyl dehydratase